MDMIYESDIDYDYDRLLTEMDLDDELAEARREYQREVASCCGGRVRDCIHYGHSN